MVTVPRSGKMRVGSLPGRERGGRGRAVGEAGGVGAAWRAKIDTAARRSSLGGASSSLQRQVQRQPIENPNLRMVLMKENM